MSDPDQLLAFALAADAAALLAKIDEAPSCPTLMLAGALVDQALDCLNAAAGLVDDGTRLERLLERMS